jgi:hypothetical protein
MRSTAAALLLLAAATPARAHQRWPAPVQPGHLVGLSALVEGSTAPLYAAVDGSGRYYLEARRGGRYTLRLANRTGERVAVLMTVDGLNVISGERQSVTQRGRMYVLDPWESADIQGWRSSLDDVRRFTFVDEQASYAARSGKSNSRMGWIELAVYRERHRFTYRQAPDVSAQSPRAEAPAPGAREKSGKDDARDADESRKRAQGGAAQSFPGTGWGEQTHDPVRVVDFEAESSPAELITLRYEYASALRALGILPWEAARDRLRERDRGEGGFAKPPQW